MQHFTENEEELNCSVEDDSCLFHSEHKLYRVQCPFLVTSLKDTGLFLKGEKLEVHQVLDGILGQLLYKVEGKLYPHHYFSYSPPHHLTITRLK